MSVKRNPLTLLQWIGLGIFLTALLLFTLVLGLDDYRLHPDSLAVSNTYHKEALLEAARDQGMLNRTYASSFAFAPAFQRAFRQAQADLQNRFDQQGAPEGVGEWEYKLGDWMEQEYLLHTVKHSSRGPVRSNPLLFWLLTIGLGILGGLLYILPKFRGLPGIKNNHIYHSHMTRGMKLSVRSAFLAAALFGIIGYGIFYLGGNYFWPGVSLLIALLITGLVLYKPKTSPGDESRSASPHATAWIGLITGLYLIGFYVLLYWTPQHLTGWMILSDPLSHTLSGKEASQWFVYGTLYTVAVLVMGVRMIAKYRHNRYQIIRTISVMFFQLAFAFLIPEILVRLNQPYFDFKNIWPLNYTFFFDWNLNNLIGSGATGLFMLVWGIALIVLAVPLLTYFYGKRWYCSWVCGCGGLAETLGDPYRQLSDKSLRAWQYERWIIHGVLVFAVIMTMGVLYSYLPAGELWFNQRNFLMLVMLMLAGAMGYTYYRWKRGAVDISRLGIRVGIGVTVLLIGISAYHLFSGSEKFFFLNSNETRQWYGFLIGSAFAGVIGTGFYPIMGNRVWCRFGCPLAAYLGLVQRFKSRFRITTNGGQCISCGNCSTYCEMGIDVRWYAQRGQDVVRSSCVGCGICAAVCPRGVLRLENSSLDMDERTKHLRALHIPESKTALPN